MNTREAAKIIGCEIRHVSTLIRNGRLRAKKKPSEANSHGYIYVLEARQVRAYASQEQPRGWPRGQSRK